MKAAFLLLPLLLPPPCLAEESLERQAARMLLVGVRGLRLEDNEAFRELVCGLKVGGLILFDREGTAPGRNIRSQEQLSTLTARLQELARRCGDAPLLIAADVEGGRVSRLNPTSGYIRIRSPAELGRSGDELESYREALLIGSMLAQSGINWNLAPVVDLDLNPDNEVIGGQGRAFSNEPDTVARHAEAFARGLKMHGILNCLKHFPGHGSSRGDSHREVVDVTRTADLDVELEPYRRLTRLGLADAVMTAHVFMSRVDPDRPATLSYAAVTGLLRRRLGFEGVVLSDDLQMAAITELHPVEEAAVLAAGAGVDVITLSNNLGRYDSAMPRKVHAALTAAVRDGRLPRERVAEASRRVLKLKARLGNGS